MAIEESEDKCSLVRQIYEWIELNFQFYRNTPNDGWKSSIRHNLSFSKCFKKTDRIESISYCISGIETAKMPFSRLIMNSGNDFNRRKRRVSNTIGTCWMVNIR